MSKLTKKKYYNNYSCEVWVKSTNKISIKRWLLILPTKLNFVGLPVKVRKFTLQCSPLGNSTSKDQYEVKEFGVYFKVIHKNLSFVLAFLDAILKPAGVKLKIQISSFCS